MKKICFLTVAFFVLIFLSSCDFSDLFGESEESREFTGVNEEVSASVLLVGTWVNQFSGIDRTLIMSSNTWELMDRYTSQSLVAGNKGTYTISGNTIVMTYTHVYSSMNGWTPYSYSWSGTFSVTSETLTLQSNDDVGHYTRL